MAIGKFEIIPRATIINMDSFNLLQLSTERAAQSARDDARYFSQLQWNDWLKPGGNTYKNNSPVEYVIGENKAKEEARTFDELASKQAN